MSYLLDQIVDMREEGKTVVEESPVQSKGSLGIAERAVQEIEGGLRGMFLALKSRLGGKLDAREDCGLYA